MIYRLFTVLVLGLTLAAAPSPCVAAGKKPATAAPAKPAVDAKKKDEVAVITVDQFKAMRKAKKRYVLIDVRTKKEFDAGHIDGAVLMPLDDLPKIYKRIPKGGTLVVSCRTGHRSAEAVKFLVEHGYKSAVSLAGGYQKWAACAKAKTCS